MDVMRRSKVKAGEWVIKQGDKGDRFFIIDSGKFEVRVNRDKDVVTEESDAGMKCLDRFTAGTVQFTSIERNSGTLAF